jgi:hypothetical protein
MEIFESCQIGCICGICSLVYFIDIKNLWDSTEESTVRDPYVAKVFC